MAVPTRATTIKVSDVFSGVSSGWELKISPKNGFGENNELNRHTTRMKIRGSVVSSSFIFPHPPEDEEEKKKKKKNATR